MHKCILTNKLGRTLTLILHQPDGPQGRWWATELHPGEPLSMIKSRPYYLTATRWDSLLRELCACTWDGQITIDGGTLKLPIKKLDQRVICKRWGLGTQYEDQVGHSRGAWWGSPGMPN